MSSLNILFRKERFRLTLLRCTRPDGTQTWTRLYPNFEIHDFAHYVVESRLGFQEAFYGCLAEGYHISDFELPKDQRPKALMPPNIPDEALQTEHLVNLLQTYFSAFEASLLLDDFRQILAEREIPFPEQLSMKVLEEIQEDLERLMEEWQALDFGESLELEFQLKDKALI
ncbi:MAG: hypothetical protein AAFV80_13800 [Bacteroidota bacterium]